jgi:NADH-quinone oxidoreductase subunit F
VDRYSLETSRSKFYAGGDLITGASNVSNAMGYGKKAARNIDQRLMGVALGPDPEFEYADAAAGTQRERAPHGRETAGASAWRAFDEAVIGLTPVEALDESLPLPALRHPQGLGHH